MDKDKLEENLDNLEDERERLRKKVRNLEKLKSIIVSADENSSISLVCRKDDNRIEVYITSDGITEEMKIVAKMGVGLLSDKEDSDNIKYDFDSDQYSIDKTFRTNL